MSFAAGLVTSSYQAELRALWEAMKWLSECIDEWEPVAVASDSLAALTAMREARGGGGRVNVWLGEVVRLGQKGCLFGFRDTVGWWGMSGRIGRRAMERCWISPAWHVCIVVFVV